MAQNMDISISAIQAKVRVHDSSSKHIATYTSFGDLGRSHMTVAGLGIEPKFSLSESDVLPLDDPALLTAVHRN